MPDKQQPEGRRFSPHFMVGLRAFTVIHTLIYRLSGGRLLNRIGSGPVLLLTTIGRRTGKQRTRGRRTGKQRTQPLVYLADRDRFVVVGSVAGAARHPEWVRNLEANPMVDVQVGRQTLRLRAEIAQDPERADLWPRLVELFPSFAEYQGRTTRELPVILLSLTTT